MRQIRAPRLAAALAAVTLLAGGCATPPPGPAPLAPGGGAPKPAPVTGGRASIFVPVLVNDEMKMARKSVPVKAEKPGPQEALQALLDYEIGGQRLFPEGVRVLKFSVDGDGRATVDLSSQIRNYYGGSMEEAGAINAIVLTAAQFKGVKTVLFLCEGQELETLGGHADLTVPQSPDSSLVEDSD